MSYPRLSSRFLLRIFFLLALGVTVFLAFQISSNTAYAGAPQIPVCMTTNGTTTTPNANVLQFIQQWVATVPTSNATCVINDPTVYPHTNGINAGLMNDQLPQSFLCGYGQSWLYPNPVAQDQYNLSSYNLGNQLGCVNGWQVGRSDSVTVEDYMTGQPLALNQHLTVGQKIIVRVNPFQNFGPYVNVTTSGPYVNLPANSYQNNWPVTSYAPQYVHCPPGGTPACGGVDIYSGYSTNGGGTQGDVEFGSSDNNGMPPQGTNVVPPEDIQPGSGWTYSNTIAYGSGDYGMVYTAGIAGNLTLTISAPSSEAAGVYGGGTGYVIPASGYSGAYGSLTTGDYNWYYTTQAIGFNALSVANLIIPVDNPPDNPPANPTVGCTPATVNNGQNTTVTMSATDPDAGDTVRFDVDPNYDGSTFNPTVSVPVTGFVASGSQQSIPLQWATGGTKTVAVRAQDDHYQNSGITTCTVTVVFIPPGPTPNMQFATDSTGTTYTDNVVHYSMSQDQWDPASAGMTIPAQYVGNTYYQSCVVRPYPFDPQGTSPYTTKSTWDAWPTLASGNTYVPMPANDTLILHGQSNPAPPVGTQLDEEFAFGCGTAAQTAQGQFSGSPDMQEVIITITKSQPPTPNVTLTVTDSGNTSGRGYVSAPQSNPYVFSEQLPSSGAYTTNAQLQLQWQTSNVDSCTFTRTDNGSPQGTFNSSQNWTNGSTSSLLNGADQGTMTFAAWQEDPSQLIGFIVSCTGSYGAAVSTVYVSFARSSLTPQSTVFKGTVFNDAGGVYGVQDAGELGIPGQTMTLTISGYTGGPTNYTAVTDSSGAYSFNITPTNPMLATGVASLTQTTALPNGWVFTAPLSGTYANYAIQNGATTVFNFGENNTPSTYSTFTGTVYNDLNGNGVLDTGEKGVANQTIQLSRVTTYSSGAPTTDTLGSALTDANGGYTVSTYIPAPVAGTTSVTYVLSETSLPGPGWQYSLPLNGVADFTAVANTVYHQNFGDIQPLTIRGVVYNDANGSGSSAGQSVLGGLKIQVYDVTAGSIAPIYDLSSGSSNSVSFVTTAADGSYSLSLGASTNGHQIQVQQITRNASYSYCTNPPQGSDGYCEYPAESAGPFTASTSPLILERDFGNSATASTSVTVVSGRVYENNDGVPGFNPAYDTPLGSVSVKISDTNGTVLATVSTDAAGLYYYTVPKYSAAYNAVIGKAIIISHVPPNSYTAVSPEGGAYPSVQYNGSTLVNYDFVDATGGGGTGNPPPPTYFCDLD